MADLPESPDLLIYDFDRLDLADYSVAGGWRTTDIEFKEKIKNWIDQYRNIVNGENFNMQSALICAPSGSGKTFFVKECYRSIRLDFILKRINIGEIPDNIESYFEAYFKEIFSELNNNNKVISLIDEFDVDVNGQYIFKYFLDILQNHEVKIDGKKKKLQNVFFFFVGSGSDSIQDFTQFTRELPKQHRAIDFLRRIDSGDQIDLPGINDSYDEKIVRAVSCAIGHKPDIEHFEKIALYWIGKSHFESAHSMNIIMSKTCQKLVSRKIVKYDDIAIGSQKRHEFLKDNSGPNTPKTGSLLEIKHENLSIKDNEESNQISEAVDHIWVDLREIIYFLNRKLSHYPIKKRYNILVKSIEAIDAIKSLGKENQHNGILILLGYLRNGELPINYCIDGINILLQNNHFQGNAKKAANKIIGEFGSAEF